MSSCMGSCENCKCQKDKIDDPMEEVLRKRDQQWLEALEERGLFRAGGEILASLDKDK